MMATAVTPRRYSSGSLGVAPQPEIRTTRTEHPRAVQFKSVAVQPPAPPMLPEKGFEGEVCPCAVVGFRYGGDSRPGNELKLESEFSR